MFSTLHPLRKEAPLAARHNLDAMVPNKPKLLHMKTAQVGLSVWSTDLWAVIAGAPSDNGEKHSHNPNILQSIVPVEQSKTTQRHASNSCYRKYWIPACTLNIYVASHK